MSNQGPVGWNVIEPLQSAEDRYEKAKEDYLAVASTNPAYATEWKLGAVLAAQAMLEIAAELEDEDGRVERETVDRWAHRSMTRLQQTAHSTSAASNLVENIRRDTRLGLLEKYIEAVRSEERQAELEAERIAKVKSIGQAVRSVRGKDERQYVGMVAHVDGDYVDIAIPVGPQKAGTARPLASDLVATDTQPYRAVQLEWERVVDQDQLAAAVDADELADELPPENEYSGIPCTAGDEAKEAS